MRHHGSGATGPADPTSYRSPAEAVSVPREKRASVVAFDRPAERPDRRRRRPRLGGLRTFDLVGRWETDRGPQHLSYDTWWHLTHTTLVTGEWGTPATVGNGVIPERLPAQEYGHTLRFWDLAEGKHVQPVEPGPGHQMALELRPAHDPAATWEFVDAAISTEDLSASIFR